MRRFQGIRNSLHLQEYAAAVGLISCKLIGSFCPDSGSPSSARRRAIRSGSKSGGTVGRTISSKAIQLDQVVGMYHRAVETRPVDRLALYRGERFSRSIDRRLLRDVAPISTSDCASLQPSSARPKPAQRIVAAALAATLQGVGPVSNEKTSSRPRSKAMTNPSCRTSPAIEFDEPFRQNRGLVRGTFQAHDLKSSTRLPIWKTCRRSRPPERVAPRGAFSRSSARNRRLRACRLAPAARVSKKVARLTGRFVFRVFAIYDQRQAGAASAADPLLRVQ